MDHLGLSPRPARAVVQADHVVPRGRAVRKVDPNGRIAPFLNPELATNFTTKRARLLAADREDAGDRNVVVGPRGPLVGPVAFPPGDAPILGRHQLDVSGGQLITELALDGRDDLVSHWSAYILLQRVVGRLPELPQIEVGEDLAHSVDPSGLTRSPRTERR